MKKIYIIAEAGVNHNGNIDIAKQMIQVAKEAGADAIKFQTFISENVASKYAEKAEYQKQNTNCDDNQLEMIKKLELSFESFATLKEYCDIEQIEFLSTAFDFESINFLKKLDLSRWKIPSGEITNLPYLIEIAKIAKPILLSTGMSTIEEIEAAIEVLRKQGANDITVLHCTTEYPAPLNDVNLLAMRNMRERLGTPIGYSDHTQGIEIATAAAALGAVVIEKHFTLDRNMEGPDHKASLEPNELKAMVKAIRNIEIALGSDVKTVMPSEYNNRDIARKSIVAKINISKGDIFTADNLTVKRPGNGMSPMEWYNLIGKIAIRDFKEDEMIVL